MKHLKRENDHVGLGAKKRLVCLKKLVLNHGASSLCTTRIHGETEKCRTKKLRTKWVNTHKKQTI